jgi:hypothetical protein
MYPDLHDLIHDARVAARSAEDGAPTHDTERMAGMALELASLHDEILDTLEPLKEALRASAREDLEPGDESEVTVIEIDGLSEEGVELGYVTVTFPPSSVKVAKGADLERLRRALGPRLSDYFTSRTLYTPVDEFRARCSAALRSADPAAAAEARVAMEVVETVDPTPRVGFKPTRRSTNPVTGVTTYGSRRG